MTDPEPTREPDSNQNPTPEGGSEDVYPTSDASKPGWTGMDFGDPDADVWPAELLEREQWMGHVGKQPFAPWAERDHPDADPTEDARWKWGLPENYVDGERVAMAEDDSRLDGRVFLQRESDPYAYVDGDDVRDPVTGDVHPAFVKLLDRLGLTYADVSQSGAGIHAQYRGDLPEGVKEAAWRLDTEPWGSNDDLPSVEIYAGKRVCVATGAHVPGTPTEITEWDADALADLLDKNDQLPAGDSRPSDAFEDFDPDAYEPEVTSSDETTDEIRDIFAALDRLDAQRVANRTIVASWNDDASTSDGERAFVPTWGRNANGTANIVNSKRWLDTGDRGGYGGAVVMAAIDAGVVDESATPRDVRGRTWFEGVDHLRSIGFEVPELQDSATSPDYTAVPPGPDENADVDADQDSEIVALTPAEVAAWAGVGEAEDVSDLTDRQKAASVWELLWRHEDYHVRVRRDNASLWAYDGGVWNPDGERTLRHAARVALGSMNYSANVLKELKAQVRSDARAEVEPDVFGLETGTLAVENGLVDLHAAATGEEVLRDLTPEDYALTRLPVEYDPEASYDEWTEYVGEWAEDGRAESLQEYVGYCLHVGEIPIHRALLLVGSGANGKGTFLSVVRALLGRENTSSIELQTLANERDAIADFYGALANIDDDLSSRKLGQGIGMFKKLVSGDRVRARQLYQTGFEYDAVGKHLYAANEVPQVDVPDEDEAFWRRWLLVEFPNYYPPGERDPTLRDELTEPDVLSGVLNWAIDGWARLLGQGHFTNEEHEAYEKRNRWQSWGDSVEKFISEFVEHDESAPNRTTGDIYRRYAAWCRENGERPESQQKLTVALKTAGVDYRKSVRVGDSVQRGFKSLGLSDDVPGLEDTPERDDRQETLN